MAPSRSQPSPETAAFVAAIRGEERYNPSRNPATHAAARNSPGLDEFLAAVRGDDDRAETAAFVAAITGKDNDYHESKDGKGGGATDMSDAEWLDAVRYGFREPSDAFAAVVLGEHNFDPNEPRDEKGRWTTGGSDGDRHSAIKYVSDHPPRRSKSGRIWLSSDKLTWDNFKGTPPPPEKRKLGEGLDKEAETFPDFQLRRWTRVTSKPERLQPPPVTAKQREVVGTKRDKNGVVQPEYKDIDVQNPRIAYRSAATIPDAKAEALMDQNKSWASDSARNDPGLLEHERYHLRISEIAAAMATKRMRAAVGVGVATDPKLAQEYAQRDLDTQAGKIDGDVRAWMNRSQESYDSKTKHGSDPAAQAAAQRQIDEQLAKESGK